MQGRRSPPSWLLLLLLVACGVAEAPGPPGSQGVLTLREPASPLGLAYGERAIVRLRYQLRGQARGGVTLRVQVAGDLGGSALSTVAPLTDVDGWASLVLTAGADEAQFQLSFAAPDAAEVLLDVSVSRRSFGSVVVVLDAGGLSQQKQVATLRASLHERARCQDLGPTLHPRTGVRSQQGEGLTAQLPFGTLLLQGYAVVARAEDVAGRLLGFGCAEIAEAVLLSRRAQAAVPLLDIFPRPMGSYTLVSQLDLDESGALWSAYGALSCPLGSGQAVLDAVVAALPAAEMPLASRIQARRQTPGADRCRAGTRMGQVTLDRLLHEVLARPGQPGAALVPLASDVRAIQRRVQLTSRLTVAASAHGDPGARLYGDHTLVGVSLQGTGAAVSYDLATAGGPVLVARDLPLPMTEDRIELPTHALTLRLPGLWQRALAEVALRPRGLPAPETLLSQAVAAASYGGFGGCAALEALICETVGAPCTGTLLPACAVGTAALGAELTFALRDAPAGLDLTLAGFVRAADPDAGFLAQALRAGQLQGSVVTARGAVTLFGPVN